MPLSKAKQAEYMRNHRAEKRSLGITEPKVIPVKAIKFRYCSVCNESRVIDSHHIDTDRSNNNEWNLVDLCPTCHAVIHRLKASIGDLQRERNPVIPKVADKLSNEDMLAVRDYPDAADIPTEDRKLEPLYIDGDGYPVYDD